MPVLDRIWPFNPDSYQTRTIPALNNNGHHTFKILLHLVTTDAAKKASKYFQGMLSS